MSIYDERHMWEIPKVDDGGPGILLSDRISYYADAVKLIDNFHPESLRPACYDLHVGDAYYLDDKLYSLKKGQSIEIPPSGLVYIKIEERLNIPYYIVARYSLRVTQVYRGLLIDNGLQIDPGYHGHIYVVVHNLSNESRPVQFGDEFLSIEFTRTTPFVPSTSAALKGERDLIRPEGANGFAGRPLSIFTKKLEDLGVSREPTFFWLKQGENDHRSSTHEMRERLSRVESNAKKFEEELTTRLLGHEARTTEAVRSLRNISFVGLTAIAAAVLIGILQFYSSFYTWYSDRYSELINKYADTQSNLARTLTEKENEISKLNESVAQLQARVKDLEQKKE